MRSRFCIDWVSVEQHSRAKWYWWSTICSVLLSAWELCRAHWNKVALYSLRTALQGSHSSQRWATLSISLKQASIHCFTLSLSAMISTVSFYALVLFQQSSTSWSNLPVWDHWLLLSHLPFSSPSYLCIHGTVTKLIQACPCFSYVQRRRQQSHQYFTAAFACFLPVAWGSGEVTVLILSLL